MVQILEILVEVSTLIVDVKRSHDTNNTNTLRWDFLQKLISR